MTFLYRFCRWWIWLAWTSLVRSTVNGRTSLMASASLFHKPIIIQYNSLKGWLTLIYLHVSAADFISLQFVNKSSQFGNWRHVFLSFFYSDRSSSRPIDWMKAPSVRLLNIPLLRIFKRKTSSNQFGGQFQIKYFEIYYFWNITNISPQNLRKDITEHFEWMVDWRTREPILNTLIGSKWRH